MTFRGHKVSTPPPPKDFHAHIKWQRLFGLIRKEAYQILRDPSSILIAFVLPLVLIFLSGYAFNLDSSDVRFGIVVEEPSPVVSSLVESFKDSTSFDVTYARSREEVNQKVIDGHLRGFIVIPQNFAQNLERFPDNIPELQLIVDGTEPNIATLLQGYTQGTLQLWLQNYRLKKGLSEIPPIEIRERIWYNANATSRHNIIPGIIAIILTVIGTLLTAMVVAREWERGTMEAMLVTPVSINEIIIGKLTPYYILGLGSLLTSFLIAIFVFNVPFRGSLFLLFLLSSFYLSATLSLGLLISTIARSQFVAAQISVFTAFLPAFFLSGFIFELDSMPKILQVISYLLPPRYFVSSLRTIFLSGSIGNILFWNSLGILAYTAVMVFFLRRKLRKSLES